MRRSPIASLKLGLFATRHAPSMQALLDAISTLELPAQACRVFHGRGGQHPGCEQWSLDFYPPVWLLTSHRRVEAVQQQQIHQALKQRWSLIAPDQTLNLEIGRAHV